jgi:RNA methyltransferase, RsmE family
MQRFFLSADHVNDDFITITGADANHIGRSLRMKIGDKLIICDMQKNEYECEISSFEKETVTVRIVNRSKNDTEPLYKSYLYQALPKGDKMDYIVQKAVELGVYSIIPFVSERCISRPDAAACKKKVIRWQRIAEEAAKQCGRGIIPIVGNVLNYNEMIQNAASGELVFFCYEGDGTEKIGNIIKGKYVDIRFIIGAEGGFSINEVEIAQNSGMKITGLGKRILRCETASGFVLSCLTYENELRV